MSEYNKTSPISWINQENPGRSVIIVGPESDELIKLAGKLSRNAIIQVPKAVFEEPGRRKTTTKFGLLNSLRRRN